MIIHVANITVTNCLDVSNNAALRNVLVLLGGGSSNAVNRDGPTAANVRQYTNVFRYLDANRNTAINGTTSDRKIRNYLDAANSSNVNGAGLSNVMYLARQINAYDAYDRRERTKTFNLIASDSISQDGVNGRYESGWEESASYALLRMLTYFARGNTSAASSQACVCARAAELGVLTARRSTILRYLINDYGNVLTVRIRLTRVNALGAVNCEIGILRLNCGTRERVCVIVSLSGIRTALTDLRTLPGINGDVSCKTSYARSNGCGSSFRVGVSCTGSWCLLVVLRV